MGNPGTSNLLTSLVTEPLAKTRLFERVSAEALSRIAVRTVRLFFRKGQIIVHQGEPGDRMFIILEGAAIVYVSSSHGESEEVVLAELGPSDTFGELTLLDGGLRSASVKATAPTEVVALGRSELRELMDEDPSMVEAMMLSLVRTVRRLTDHTSDAVFFDVHQRVASLILDLARERAGPFGGVLELDLRRTERELADLLGRSRQSVAQVLRLFEQMGCLELRDRVIYVRDPDALRQQMSAEMTWAELANKALHDPLTRLANRRLFGDRVTSSLSRVQRHGGMVGVIFIDLDDFKRVNDRHGHAVGDHLLVKVADRLRNRLRASDTAARFGGDEFGILLEDVTNPSAAMIVADRIVDDLAKPFELSEVTVTIGASVGLALADQSGQLEQTELFHRADTAMYQAKQFGKGRLKTYGVNR